MNKKATKTEPKSPPSALQEAIDVRSRAFADLDECELEDRPKFYDAYTRAGNHVRQLEKDRKKSLTEFTDDEIVEYIRSLPERRRDALLVAVQATALAGKPLFG